MNIKRKIIVASIVLTQLLSPFYGLNVRAADETLDLTINESASLENGLYYLSNKNLDKTWNLIIST